MAADAPAATDPPLSLKQAIDEALKSNPGLKSAGHQNRAAEGDASATARGRWGGLNAVGSYSYLNDDQIIRPMSSELVANGLAGVPWDRSQAHYGVSYDLPLYLGGRLNNQIQIVRLEARKSADLLEGTRWQVRFNDWQPGAHPMQRTPDGCWTTRLELRHGSYRYLFLVDGQPVLDSRALGIVRTPNDRYEAASLLAVS
ncbi:MAG: TolC family protein [Verrucomicrobia bacterium]|nr:TolC family protein [Verrucomicrobiota bacterium]